MCVPQNPTSFAAHLVNDHVHTVVQDHRTLDQGTRARSCHGNDRIAIDSTFFSSSKYKTTTNLQRIDASQPTLFVLVFDDDERRTEFIETQRTGNERHGPVFDVFVCPATLYKSKKD